MEVHLQGHLQSSLRYCEVLLRVDVQLRGMEMMKSMKMFGGV